MVHIVFITTEKLLSWITFYKNIITQVLKGHSFVMSGIRLGTLGSKGRASKGRSISHTMRCNTISSPPSGAIGGVTGTPFSKKSIGDFTGSNFEGAHHLKKNRGKIITSFKCMHHSLKRCTVHI